MRIETKGLSLRFGAREVLADVSLTLEPGRIRLVVDGVDALKPPQPDDDVPDAQWAPAAS